MPALQVRDFPDDLYEDLKRYAASQHRSVAQQTIVAVEQMLANANASHYWDGETLHRMVRSSRLIDSDTEAARAERIKKRKELFARIEANKASYPSDMPDAVEIVHEGRRERDRQISDVLGLPYAEEV